MPVRLTVKQIISILKENGFMLIGKKGHHQKWHNPNTGATTIIPCHGNNQIAIGTIYSIIRASKLDKSLFGF